jgi:DNA-binding NarL/FixJ family response regulator
MEIRVLIVEDQEAVRLGLAYLVDNSHGLRCAGAFADAETALAELAMLEPDIVLMDIGLPGMSGIEAVRKVKAQRPTTQVMMLTVYEDESRIFESLRAGATGYILKTTPPGQLVESITVLHSGGSPMSSQIARCVVELFHAPAPTPDPASELTAREREIMELLVRGFRYREIGDRLFISIDTVRTHIRHIYEKMQVRSRTEATVRYLQR